MVSSKRHLRLIREHGPRMPAAIQRWQSRIGEREGRKRKFGTERSVKYLGPREKLEWNTPQILQMIGLAGVFEPEMKAA
jgi:hypothetical protein